MDFILRKRTSIDAGDNELDVRRLEELICIDIPKQLDMPLQEQYKFHARRFQGNIAINKEMKSSRSLAQLLNVEDLFSILINEPYSAQLSQSTLAEIHYFLGFIEDLSAEYDQARESYVRAVWLSSHGVKSSDYVLSAALYRLGKWYGRKGDVVQMESIMKRALDIAANAA